MVWNAMLHLHGTAQRPNHMQIQPRRVYADEAIIPSIIDQSEV